MPLVEPLFYLFAAVSVLYVTHFGIYLVGANAYDIWQARRRRRPPTGRVRGSAVLQVTRECAATVRYAGSFPDEVPGLVSIVIAAHDEEAGIARTLDSIRLSTYRRVEVIVADDASTDRTADVVRDYQRRHPEMDLRIVTMAENVGKGAALSTVLRRHARGEFVMTLDADSLISPTAVANALTYFADPMVAGVAANVQIIDEPTLLGVLQRLEHMIGYRSKKFYSVTKCEFVVGGVASTYRMRVLRRVGFYSSDSLTEDIGLSATITRLGNKRFRLVYAADVVAQTEGVLTFRALARQRYRWKYGCMQVLVKHRGLIGNRSEKYTRALTLYRMPLAVISEFTLLVSPLAWTYAAYMTLTQDTPLLVLGAFATVTAYTLVTVWMDENLGVGERLRLSLYAPTGYFLFYVMDLVQLTAIVRCLARPRGLVRRSTVRATWVSPQRAAASVPVPAIPTPRSPVVLTGNVVAEAPVGAAPLDAPAKVAVGA